MEKKEKFITIISAFVIVVIIGIVGYMLLLDVSFIDALYMTAITISTVGYTEVGEMTDPAKIFSIFIIFAGLAVAGYGFTSVVTLFFDGEFRDVWRKKRMQDRIANIKDHYIVCGAGEIGQIVSKQLKESKMDFLVIERNPHKIDELEKDGILVVNGDATHEEVLLRSNIEEAKGLVSTLSNDADNVFTVLTARQLNHDMYIVSKAIEKSAHNKLKKAGADNTISPNEIGGRRMAALLIRPSVISFLDVITQAGDVTLDLEEVVIDPKSSLCQKTLLDANIPEKTGLIIMAIKKKGDTKVKFSPRYNDVLEPGDTMVVLGTDDQVEVLRKMAKAD